MTRVETLALKFIKKNISSDNVLIILQHLYVFHNRDGEDSDLHYEPSAPPLELLERNEEVSGGQGDNLQSPAPTSDKEVCQISYLFLEKVKQILKFSFKMRFSGDGFAQSCEKVICNCFEIIDKNAKKILESDEFEDISLQLVKEIIKRDGLELSSGKTNKIP